MGVNLIVSCTKRKTRAAAAFLRLRGVPVVASIEHRATEWLRRLRSARSDLLPARQLYAGAHWSVVRAIDEREAVRVWICSAGYGLITPDSLLTGYDATFTSSQPDSVLAPGASKALLPRWWAALGAWQGPQGASCRSIAAVAATFPTDFILVALSDGYLRAVSADVRQAASQHGERLAIISAGAADAPGLEEALLPCDSRLQTLVGGVLASLNVRLALRLLESCRKELSLTRCRNLFRTWLTNQPERAAPARAPLPDDEVQLYIEQALLAEPGSKPSRLLRQLRDQGRACEHRRFFRLFHEVVARASV